MEICCSSLLVEWQWWCRILPVMNCDTVGVNNDQLSNDPTSDKGEDDRASWSAAICCCPSLRNGNCVTAVTRPTRDDFVVTAMPVKILQWWWHLNWAQGFMVLRNTKPIGSSNICNGQRTNIKRLWSKGWLHPQCHHQSSSGQASSDKIMMWEHLGARWWVVKIFGMFGWVSSTSTLSTQVNTGQDDNRRKFPHFPMEHRDSVGHNGQWAVKFDDRTQR